MRTIPEAVRNTVLSTPFLEEGLASGIINLSALARRLRPELERELLKPVGQAAVVMALARFARELRESSRSIPRLAEQLGDVTVRSGLCELTVLASESVPATLTRLLDDLRRQRRHFVTFTQGVREVTVILEAELLDSALAAFADERVVARLDGLSGITLRLAPSSVSTPGVHYGVLKQLAMRAINVIEVVSTYTELTVVLQENEVDRAFRVLLALTRGRQR